jgi:hypothetical protein
VEPAGAHKADIAEGVADFSDELPELVEIAQAPLVDPEPADVLVYQVYEALSY